MEAWPKRMSWLATKLFFKKTWIFLKEYWQIPFVIVWTTITVVLTRRNTEALKEVILIKKESHKKQIEILKKGHEDEILKLKKVQKQYLETMQKLEQKFKEQDRALSDKHVKHVKDIVVKSQGNPEEIIRKIESEFGIKFKK